MLCIDHENPPATISYSSRARARRFRLHDRIIFVSLIFRVLIMKDMTVERLFAVQKLFPSTSRVR